MPGNGNTFAIVAPTLFDGDSFLHDHCVVVRGDSIAQILPAADCASSMEVQRLDEGTLAPGLIDLQVNGGGNVMFHNEPTPTTIETMLAAHRKLGTTSMLPTVLSDTLELQQAAVNAVKTALNRGNQGVLGIHIEGPFFNDEKRGAHREDRIRQPLAQDIDWLCSPQGFAVMVTLAPEQVSPEQIAQLANSGVLVCAGHTSASYEQIEQASTQGLQGITHLFNAMGSISARQPGTSGAALDIDALWAGIIADGHHVHPAGIRLAHKAKPSGKLLLVSDAMATVGGTSACFEIYGETICEQEGRLVNADGVLAGSAIGLMDAVRFCHREAGLPLTECLRMASLYPAQILGLDTTLGRVTAGQRADLVHFDSDFQVHSTWVAGIGARHIT